VASGYRVYLVVLPQTHLTVAADRIDAGVGIGRDLVDGLDTARSDLRRARAEPAAAEEAGAAAVNALRDARADLE
jgi:hypothetical protein